MAVTVTLTVNCTDTMLAVAANAELLNAEVKAFADVASKATLRGVKPRDPEPGRQIPRETSTAVAADPEPPDMPVGHS